MPSFTLYAVTAVEQYLTMLLGVVDAIATQDSDVACHEFRSALERSIRALHGMHSELTTIARLEAYVRAQQAS
ncbi:MAG: hypothetical protein KF773_17445 [Deltaproteobacteria bacterium]|nr:hypothetical protein [Deltaproteobacteria bacterium]